MIELWLRKLFTSLHLGSASPEQSGSNSTQTTPSGYYSPRYLLIGVPAREKEQRQKYLTNKYGIREEVVEDGDQEIADFWEDRIRVNLPSAVITDGFR
jgi:hypothetical protein